MSNIILDEFKLNEMNHI